MALHAAKWRNCNTADGYRWLDCSNHTRYQMDVPEVLEYCTGVLEYTVTIYTGVVYCLLAASFFIYDQSDVSDGLDTPPFAS